MCSIRKCSSARYLPFYTRSGSQDTHRDNLLLSSQSLFSTIQLLTVLTIVSGLCPGTGTPEAGGWTSREVIRILRGLESLNVVGADIVEVAPAYDGAGEQTALVAAQVGYEMLTSWVGRGTSEMEKIDPGAGSSGGTRDEL